MQGPWAPRLLMLFHIGRGFAMDQEAFNMSLRKFLKVVGVTSQREIEQAVTKAMNDGRLAGNERLVASVTLEVTAVNLQIPIKGEIQLE